LENTQAKIKGRIFMSVKRAVKKVSAPDPGQGRLTSLDALRGFAMFWIMGADLIIPDLAKAFPSPFLDSFALQFDHVAWNGLRFYDLIYPTFMFAVGASIPFSFAKHQAQGTGKEELYSKILKRGFWLFVLGIIYNGFFRLDGWAHFRFMGVLQRIALTYVGASFIYLNTNLRARILWACGLLISYWGVLALIPVPGYGVNMTPEGNLVGYLDRLILAGSRMCCYDFGDNEGLLSNIPAIVTVLFGVFAGEWLRSNRSQLRKVYGLVWAGLAGLVVGYTWDLFFPINKNLWTSSFMCAAAGYSTLALAAFYWMMDIKKWQAWAFFLVVIGLNPITIYLGQGIIDFNHISSYFLKGLSAFVVPCDAVLLTLGMLAAKIGFLYVLYRQKIFLRL
jgi:predicted acyltransferase